MSTPVRTSRRPTPMLVAGVARLLAAHGVEALDEVADLVARTLSCAHVTVRGPEPSQVLARSHPPGPAGLQGRWALDAPMRAGGVLHGVLTAEATRPFTAEHAAVLTAVADVAALALAADHGEALARAGRLVLDEEADRAALTAGLLDAVGRALVTVRYTAGLVIAGQAAPAELDDPVRAALAVVRQANRDLRAHALERGLRAALRELADRRGGDRPDDGQPPLQVTVEADDPALDQVAPPVAVTVQRVAEARLGGATGHARVCANVHDRMLKLTVETADNAYDAGELVRWARRVSALGGTLRNGTGGVEVRLPVQPTAEGHHDDGPDL